MTKNELIEALQAIPGNDIVILDCDGRFSTDYRPELRSVDQPLLHTINARDNDVAPKPKLGDTVILL